ncbi:MAG: segregation/condensation protein A [Clostridia bacterium]|nr:segregation/condensation protein A [Clostridia bacterium]
MELQLKLNQFEGPLDLLLHLLDKDKIDIKDIFVSDITEQYLAYIAGIEEFDMENASEFLTVAAHLLEIKSRSLLPKPAPLEEGEEDPEAALIRRLTEYKMYKEAGEKLHSMEEETLKIYYKLPEEIHLQERIELNEMKLDSLMAAFNDVLKRFESKTVKKQREIKRDAYTVKGKMAYIRRRLSSKKKMSFFEMFEDDGNKSEVVTTFAAMLELWKNRYLLLEQKETFGDITVSLNMEAKETEAKAASFDEEENYGIE